MADEIDIANDLIDNEVSRALSRLRTHTPNTSKGSKYCVECDDAIPLGRQKLGFNLCISCAEDTERKKTLFAE